MRVCPQCRAVYCTDVWICNLDGEGLIDSAEDPLVGGSVDRYRVLGLLGQGATGRVYRARHAVLDRTYAIKVLYGDYAGEPKFQERFRREAQSVSRIRHPNIVTVEDFGATQHGLPFLVLELVEGESLEARIAARGALSAADAVSVAKQVASGLAAAHEHGFVHRDVKPSNVMLFDEGGIERVKLLDFGAVSLLAVPRDQRLTRMGHIIGTPTYMAPEQSQDPGVGPTADLYALGVILFEMLTGRPPFDGSTRAEVMIQHIADPPPSLPMMGGLETIVARLLEKDPADRPPSAAALIDLLDRLQTQPRKVAFSPSEPEPPAGGGFPSLDEPEDEIAEWGDWAREATIEPYAPSALPTEAGAPWSSKEPAASGWPPDSWDRPSAEVAARKLDGDAVRKALAHDLTIDEAALLYEPAMPSEASEGPAGDDGATQVDFRPEDDALVGAEARTELEHPPEPSAAPFEAITPPEPLPSLSDASAPEPPWRASASPSGDLPLEAPVEIVREPPTLLGGPSADGLEERARAADPATDPHVSAAARAAASPPPRLPSDNLGPAPDIASGEGVYEDEAPTRASSSGPIPVVPVSLTGEDADLSSGAGRDPSPPLAELGLPRARPAPRGHQLVGLDDESTAAVRRRRPSPPVRVRVDHRGRLERLLLPVTVALLVAAAAALAGALVLRSTGGSLPALLERLP